METSTNLKFILNRPAEQEKPGGDENQNTPGGDGNSNTPGGNSNNIAPNGSTNRPTNSSSGQTIYTTDNSTIAVPNTGERVSAAKTSGQSALLPIFIGLFIVVAVAIVAKAIGKQRKSHLRFSDDASKLGIGPLQISLVGSSTFALLFVGMSLINNASIENQKTADAASTLAISSLNNIEKKIEDHFDDSNFAYVAEDTVKVEADTNAGYRVFVQAESDKLYLDGDSESKDFFSPAADGKLQDGAWGYRVGEAESWAAVSTTPAEIANIATTENETNSSETKVYYGVNPTDELKNGSYSTKITYTVIPEGPAPEPTTPECSATVHPTVESSCKMADGKEWILGNSGNSITWNDMFTGATGENGHDATLNANICPAGFTAPKITDYDALIQAYGGTPVSLNRDGYEETTGALYRVLGLSEHHRYFWSSTESSGDSAYFLLVDKRVDGSSAASQHDSLKTYGLYVLCLGAEASEPENPNPENPENPNPENPNPENPENPNPENPENPNPENPNPETPEPGTIPECSATVHPTVESSCKMADGKEWILGNSGNGITWNDMFTGATGENDHNATVNADICPAGYAAPTIADYNGLIQAYGGTQDGENHGYYENTGDIYKALGLSSYRAFWSATESSSNYAYRFYVNENSSNSSLTNTKTSSLYALCLKSS